MRINDDLTQPVIAYGSWQDWVASPAREVDRRMLFRIGEEKARATSIVRYAPGSSFSAHVHTGGEEFLVLDGTFQDGDGDYPAGSYVRNPPGTSHAPAAKDGATIFVRLWQFRADDQAQTVRRPGEGEQVTPRRGGDTAIILFRDGHEEVRLERWQAHAAISVDNPEGLEFLVVSGSLAIGDEIVSGQDWGRFPAGTNLDARVGPAGATMWMKLGPLLHSDVVPF